MGNYNVCRWILGNLNVIELGQHFSMKENVYAITIDTYHVKSFRDTKKIYINRKFTLIPYCILSSNLFS